MKIPPIRIAPAIRLRKEYFGGLVYDRRNGNTLEIDKEAFRMLTLLKDKAVNPDALSVFLIENKITKSPINHIHKILQELIELEIIELSDQPPARPWLEVKNPDHNMHKNWLSAPETVHWAVTCRCPENCPDCYMRRLSRPVSELRTEDALKLIDKIADWGVFQLAIGGGEPFARHDLPRLVHRAADRGLSVHVTTGKLHLKADLLADLSRSLKVLQMGIRTEDVLGPGSKETALQIQKLLHNVQSAGITPGVNLILNKSTLKQLPNLVNRLARIGFRRMTLLRYKPPASTKRWEAERPTIEQMKQLHTKIERIVQHNPQLNLRVDCALSFVQRHLPSELAARLGIKGCVAADRILALAPDGSAYPCSQLVHLQCNGGNLLETAPRELWDKSKTLDCKLDYAFYGENEYSDYDYYDEEEDDSEAGDGAGETGDYLLDLLAKSREYLKNGDYRLLYGVWQLYGLIPDDDEELEEEVPPEPTVMDRLPEPVETLLSLLDK